MVGGKFPSCFYDPKFTPGIHHSITLVSTPANYLVSLLTYKAFACSIEYMGLNWLIYFPIYKPCFQTLSIRNLNTRSPENTISMNCILKRLKSTFFLKWKKKKCAVRLECRFLMREGDVPHEKNGEKWVDKKFRYEVGVSPLHNSFPSSVAHGNFEFQHAEFTLYILRCLLERHWHTYTRGKYLWYTILFLKRNESEWYAVIA